MSELDLTPATAPVISREAMRSFVDGVGDPNPVHTDPEFAAKAGLPDVVVQAPRFRCHSPRSHAGHGRRPRGCDRDIGAAFRLRFGR